LLAYPRYIGDLNNDNRLNVSDVMLLVNIVLENNKDYELVVADINEDGAVNVTDVMCLINIILKNEDPKEIEEVDALYITDSDEGVTYKMPSSWRSDVTVSISYELSNGMTKSDIDADCNNDGVDTVTVSSVTNNEYGKKPKVTIKLKADSDYTFKGISKSDVTITGDDATLTKVSSGTSSVTLTLTLPKIGTTDETSLEISDVSWGEDDDGRVEWEQADDADKYERHDDIVEEAEVNLAHKRNDGFGAAARKAEHCQINCRHGKLCHQLLGCG
jgi:hypothetical protein